MKKKNIINNSKFKSQMDPQLQINVEPHFYSLYDTYYGVFHNWSRIMQYFNTQNAGNIP